ncbi:MAG: hypothetical protein ABFD54_10110 [Armatimonadota bacterium]|nr:hypothetical protein [bacterium]
MARVIIAVVVLVLCSSFYCAAQSVPDGISYQGKLTDQSGAPVPDGTYQVQFKMYTDASGANPFWTSQEQTVSTNAGIFSTQIRPISTSNLAGKSEVWLETWVGTPLAPLSPRVKLASVPFALVAASTVSAPQPRSSLTPVPYNTTMVAYHSDDIRSEWVTPSSVLGGISPALYCARKGVPVSHGIVGDWVGKPGYMTINDIRSLFLMAGCEFVSQSKTHSSVTPQTVYDEVISQKPFIESLFTTFSTTSRPEGFPTYPSDTNFSEPYIQRLGLACRGFSNPGNWNTSPDSSLDRAEVHEGWLGQAILSTYDWALLYGNAGLSCSGFSVGPDTGWASIESFSVSMISPGTRVQILGDQPSATQSMTQWKATIDALAAAQDAGKIICVSDSTLRSGIMQPMSMWGGLNNADFELSTTGDMSSSNNGGWFSYQSGTAEIIQDDQGKAARLKGNWVLINQPFQALSGGRTYKLRIKAKASSQSGVSLMPQLSYGINVGGSRKYLRFYLPPISITDSYQTYFANFGVPSWSRGGMLSIISTTSIAGATADIQSIEMALN